MPKTIKDKADSASGIVISSNATRVMGKKDNYVLVDERGTTVNGPVSFVNGTDQIRVGGLWTFNNNMALSLPSTLATPTPTLIINPPIRQFVSLMRDSMVMIGLLSTFSSF